MRVVLPTPFAKGQPMRAPLFPVSGSQKRRREGIGYRLELLPNRNMPRGSTSGRQLELLASGCSSQSGKVFLWGLLRLRRPGESDRVLRLQVRWALASPGALGVWVRDDFPLGPWTQGEIWAGGGLEVGGLRRFGRSRRSQGSGPRHLNSVLSGLLERPRGARWGGEGKQLRIPARSRVRHQGWGSRGRWPGVRGP